MRLFASATTELMMDYASEACETAAAFANTDGGVLYIGVSPDGSIAGLADVNTVYMRMAEDLRSLVRPSVEHLTAFHVETMEGLRVLEVTVRRGSNSPYFMTERGICPEGVPVRLGASNAAAGELVIRRMIRESDGEKYEELRSIDQALTFSEAEREFEARGIPFGLAPRKALKLMTGDRVYTNLGLLLSDQNPHTLKTAVFEGTAGAVFRERAEFTGSLLRQVNDLWDYLSHRNAVRGERRDYPVPALAEALLNAFVHRDYGAAGSSIVGIYDDRAEFASLGGLSEGLSLDDVMLGVSVPRNENLAKVFAQLALIPACGTGLRRIARSYGDFTLKPSFEATLGVFKVTLPNTNAEREEERLNENERTVMTLFKIRESITRRDAQLSLSLSQAMAVRVMRSLVEKGEVRAVGNGRSTRYVPSR